MVFFLLLLFLDGVVTDPTDTIAQESTFTHETRVVRHIPVLTGLKGSSKAGGNFTADDGRTYHFTTESLLGTGNFASVFRAVDIEDPSNVIAVKRIRATLDFGDEQAALKVQGEFLGYDPEQFLLGMTLHEGKTARQWFESGTLTQEERDALFPVLERRVQELHSRGFAHRDLKLENIILSSDKKDLHLVDFSISARLSDYPADKQTSFLRLDLQRIKDEWAGLTVGQANRVMEGHDADDDGEPSTLQTVRMVPTKVGDQQDVTSGGIFTALDGRVYAFSKLDQIRATPLSRYFRARCITDPSAEIAVKRHLWRLDGVGDEIGALRALGWFQGENKQRHLVGMTLLEGRPYQDYINDDSLSEVEKHRLYWEAQKTVKEFHELGYAHRQLTAGNLIISSDRTRVFLGDFVLAERLSDFKEPTQRDLKAGDLSKLMSSWEGKKVPAKGDTAAQTAASPATQAAQDKEEIQMQETQKPQTEQQMQTQYLIPIPVGPKDDPTSGGRFVDSNARTWVFSMEDRIGSGNFALLFRARPEGSGSEAQNENHSVIAVKRQLAKLAIGDEVGALKAMDMFLGEDPEKGLIGMPLYEGQTLQWHVQHGGWRAEGNKARAAMLLAVAEAEVRKMHSRGYAHRDLKAANMIISPCMKKVHLIDFSLAESTAAMDAPTRTLYEDADLERLRAEWRGEGFRDWDELDQEEKERERARQEKERTHDEL